MLQEEACGCPGAAPARPARAGGGGLAANLECSIVRERGVIRCSNSPSPYSCQQAPNIAIDRLLIEFFARPEIAADHRGLDARIDSRAVQGQQTSFAIPIYADGRMLLGAGEPIDGREHLLHLVTDDVPAHLVGHAIDEFTVRLVRPAVQYRHFPTRCLAGRSASARSPGNPARPATGRTDSSA